jgi:hypothetical protein
VVKDLGARVVPSQADADQVSNEVSVVDFTPSRPSGGGGFDLSQLLI